MNILLQRHKARCIYIIPEGLKELMSDISREVLRNQPEQMYNFIADYLDALMITRENARVAAKTVENIIAIGETIVGLLQHTGMSREEANKIAETTQKAFQKYVADKEAHKFTLSPEPFEERDITIEVLEEYELPEEQSKEAATIIQRAFRLFRQRQDRAKDLLLGMVDWRVAARSTMRLYRKLGVTYEEANRAATLIKAAYKGYYSRRVMNRLLGKTKQIESSGEHLAYERETTSFWDQSEKETVEEQKHGVRDEELHVGFVQIEGFKGSESILPSGLTSPSISTTRSVYSDKPESIKTSIIKAPVEDLQTDASGLTDVEETVTIDLNSEN